MQRRNNSDYNYVFAVCMFNYNMSIFIDSLSLTLMLCPSLLFAGSANLSENRFRNR